MKNALATQECRYCHQWPTAVDDSYCGFCGRLLLLLEVAPDAVVLISGLVQQKEVVLRNLGTQAMAVSIVPRTGPLFSAVTFEPSGIVEIHPQQDLRLRVTLDGEGIPPDLRERVIEYVCLVNDDVRKQRPLKVTVRSGPRPQVLVPFLDFGNVTQGRTVERPLEVLNGGGIPLRVTGVRAEGSRSLRVGGDFAERRIDPGSRLTIPVLWESRAGEEPSEAEAEAGIRVEFGNFIGSLFIPARARSYRYLVEVKPPSVRFLQGLAKREYSAAVRLENNGTSDIEIIGIETDQPWLGVISPATTFTLLCAQTSERRAESPTTFERSCELKVTCRPAELPPGKHTGTVTVRVHQQDPLVVPVEIEVVKPRPYHDYIGIDFGTTNSVVAVLGQKQRAIELVKDEGSHLIPSVLVFDDPYNYKIGQAAKKESGAAPDRTVRSIKRVMGYENDRRYFDRPYSAGELASLIIRKLVQLAEQKLHEAAGEHYEVRKAIITVPANFFDLQIREVLDACAAAGLDTEHEIVENAARSTKEAIGESVNAGIILDEPSAAVLYYIDHLRRTRDSSDVAKAIDRPEGLRLLVFDYGGGTLDVSVASVTRIKEGGTGLRILANMGDNTIGGDTIDLILMKELLNRCRKEIRDFAFDTSLITSNHRDLELRCDREGCSPDVWRELLRVRGDWKDLAESTKIELAQEKRVDIDIHPHLIVRVHNGRVETAPRNVRIGQFPQSAFENALQPILAKCASLIEASLSLSGLKPEDIDYVLHTGRQSLLPAIRNRVREVFAHLGDDRDLLHEEHLKICVAKGAALYGAMRNALVGKDARIHFLSEGRRLPHSYGVETFISPLEPEFDEVIPRGASYPVESSKRYPADMVPPGGHLNIKFYQNTGAGKTIVGNPQISLIGQISINANDDGKPGCDVSFVVGANRTLDVFADGKPVMIERARLHEEEGWMG